ncbi:hypothetical protein E4T47_01717 [Aureobasidium subglaciale]|nr:hypothetical protein E4T47_01717 [Aureobasidium subglaciale]
MDVSELVESTTHASPSPDGHYIAGLTPDHLYVYYASTLTIASSFPTDNSTAPTTRSTEAPVIHWTPCSLSVILQTSNYVSLYSLANTASRVKIANGSASLGRIASVDVFGEDVVVVWEFGRAGIFEVGRGRVTEIGELKTGIGSLKAAWGIRRIKGKAEGMSICMIGQGITTDRNSTCDVVSYFCHRYSVVGSVVVHYAFHNDKSTDNGRSITGLESFCILDTPLSAPGSATHMYTADGNYYRSYPPTTSIPSEETYTLGPLRQSWGPDHLALANADGSITILSTTTFSPIHTLDMWTMVEEDISAVYREQVSSKGDRNWAYLGNGDDTTSQLLSSYSPALEMKFDATGRYLAFRLEAFPETVLVWTLPSSKPIFASRTQNTTMAEDEAEKYDDRGSLIVFHHHTTIKKLQWHPTISGLLLTHTEDNQIYLSSTVGETNAPLHITHPFSTSASSSTSSTTVNELINIHWATSSTILITTKRRGWILAYPFGAPSPPSSPVKSQVSAGTLGVEEQGEIEEDSLYDILNGRTPLPALRISDELPVDSEDEGEKEQGLQDTFRGRGTAGTMGSFEY